MWKQFPLKATERPVLVVVDNTINNRRGISHETKKREKTQRILHPKRSASIHFCNSSRSRVSTSNWSLWSSYEDVSHQLFPLVPVSVTDLKSTPLCWLRHKSASSWPSNLNGENVTGCLSASTPAKQAFFPGWSGFRGCSSLSLPSHSFASLLSLQEFCKNPPTDWSSLAAQSLPETLPLGTQKLFSSNFLSLFYKHYWKRRAQKLHSTGRRWRARISLLSLCRQGMKFNVGKLRVEVNVILDTHFIHKTPREHVLR